MPERLVVIYKNSEDTEFKDQILHNLARIYHKETSYDGSWWWGTRPDTNGPYYRAIEWEGTAMIRDFILAEWKKHAPADKELFTNSTANTGLELLNSVG